METRFDYDAHCREKCIVVKSIAFELIYILFLTHPPIHAPLLHQLLVCSTLLDVALHKYIYAIRVADCA
jgi:hypothetical protein